MSGDWDGVTVEELISRIRKRNSSELLTENDVGFLHRVLATSQSVYRDRAEAVGLSGLGRVLDAGCGFGQWSALLARLNKAVDAIDLSSSRIRLARSLCEALGIANVAFHEGSIETLPFNEETFDGIFSYSVVYLTDWRKSLAEFARCLKPGGLLYVNTNGLGWYLLNLAGDRKPVEGFSPEEMAKNALVNSFRYYGESKREIGQSIVMPSELVASLLSRLGLQILALGPDGSIALNGRSKPQSFFAAEACGVESVWEVVCRKVVAVEPLT